MSTLEEHTAERPSALRLPGLGSGEGVPGAHRTLQRFIEAIPLAAIALTFDGGQVCAWNSAARALFGWTAQEAIGRPVPFVPEEDWATYARIRELSQREPIGGMDLQRVRKDGSPVWIRLWTTLVESSLGEPIAVLGFISDETARKAREAALERQQQLGRLLEEVAIAANEADTLEPPLRRTLRVICETARWPLGHAWLVEGGTLRDTAIWSGADSPRYEAFRRATEGGRPTVGELPGRVLAEAKPVIAEELDGSLGGERSVAAKEAGLVSGFAFPLSVRSEVAAVLEFFSVTGQLPDPLLIDVMAHVGAQLGRVVERERAAREKMELLEQRRLAEAEAMEARRSMVLSKLSARERAVLECLAEGADNLKIGALLGISERTVKAHVSSLLQKLQVENRTQAALVAHSLGVGRQ